MIASKDKIMSTMLTTRKLCKIRIREILVSLVHSLVLMIIL